tara:strand:+ start:144 stop:389 length:246 start_codon:yes stop_codon:yes gene_type:complete
MLYRNDRQGEEQLSFTARMSGTYKFGFSNEMSSVTEKEIEFLLTAVSNHDSAVAMPGMLIGYGDYGYRDISLLLFFDFSFG